MIIHHTDYLTTHDFLILMDSWNNKLMQFMLHSETICSKFMMAHIEWSPTVSLWLSRRWLLHRVRSWMLGNGIPDPRNMIKDCYRLNLPDPRTSTYGTICAQIMVTDQEIRRLAKDAPALRRQHLLDLIETAEANNDHERARAILQMMKREHRSRVWRGINYSTQLPHGGNPLAI
jgi:hypothetical protein